MFEILLLKIGAALNKLKLDYMIIGSQAAFLPGEPGLTKDIDVILAADTDQLSIVLNLLKKLNLKVLVDESDVFTKKTKVLPVAENSSGIRIDFIFSSSEYEKTAISRAVTVKYGKTAIKLASIEDLIIHKIIAGEPKDIENVKSILFRNSEFDKKYIKKWLGEFDKTFDTSYVESFKSMIRKPS
jgi:hypothetical protein